MIDWLSLRHFAITSSVELEFKSGFSAITGETGSGKSLVVDALGVLLGGRAEQGFIRHGEDEAEISGGFELPEGDPVFAWLAERELASEQEIILRRVIRRDRPSRNFVNGKPVTASVLQELGAMLVDIHGQSEHHSLARRPVQQALLDEAAGNGDLLAQLGAAWDRYSAVERDLRALEGEQASIGERMDLLRFQISELEQLAPEEGEWDRLSAEQKRLGHAAELLEGVNAALQSCYDDDQAAHGLLERVAGDLRHLERYDASTGEIAALLEEAAINVSEAADRLRDYADRVDLDPEALRQAEERLSTWHALARKHRVNPADLAAHWSTLRETLDGLSDPAAERERLSELRDAALNECRDLAARISKRRKKTARRLAADIAGAMQELGMSGGRFDIALLPVKPGPISRNGSESVEFQVSANAGQPLQPLARVASGGEISRISLAIQVILAGAASVPTLIFDEVDVGIGGTVANVVGQRLRELGNRCQVISVTHLPQVAARAMRHYSVAKRDAAGGVDVNWTFLDRDQRVAEIARMSGSDRPSAESSAHALQMLDAGDPLTGNAA